MKANKPTALNLLQIGGEHASINATEIKRMHYDVSLDTEIGEPQEYREFISCLFNANEEDTFNIFINSPGGNLNTCLAIIEGLKNTNASVTAILLGECHSAASMIAMYCHDVAVLDSAHMMVHTANYGTVGSTGNVKAYTDFTTKQVEGLLDTTYEWFLEKEEIEKVKLGVEIWLDSSDIRSRFERRLAKFTEAQEKEQSAKEEPKKKKR